MASISDILSLMPQARALRAADMLRGASATYPALTAEFTYPVAYNRYGAGAPIADISHILAQGLGEHNAAVASGTEDALPSWWPEKDIQPRGGPQPASGAVSDVKILPDNSIVVRFGNKGKFYTFKRTAGPREASEAVADLVSNPAGMGRALADGNKRHIVPGDEGIPDIGVGSFRRSV